MAVFRAVQVAARVVPADLREVEQAWMDPQRRPARGARTWRV